jgi:hypothetical protein
MIFVTGFVTGCSRPAPIARDPAAAPLAPLAPEAGPVETRSFMETDGGTDCYREVRCVVSATSACAERSDGAPYDPANTEKLRAETPPKSWCCHARTVCEFPYEK